MPKTIISTLTVTFVIATTALTGPAFAEQTTQTQTLTAKQCESRHLSCGAACGARAPAGAGVKRCLEQCSRNKTHCIKVLVPR